MNTFIIKFMLILMGIGAHMHVYATDLKPVRDGNTIAGHVIEKGTEASLSFATISILETGEGTISDENGNFIFKKIMFIVIIYL